MINRLSPALALGLVLALATVAVPPNARAAQEAPPTSNGGTTSTPVQEEDPDSLDRRPDPVQPDFTVVNLPTSLRLPRFGSAFRVTHRFSRSLGDGDFGDLLSDLFGLDNSAQIGLEYRFGVWRGAQVGIRRTNTEKTVELFGTYDLLPERDGWPVGLALHASVDGTNNFRDSYSPALGIILSRKLGRYGALYVEPVWVNNTNPQPSELVDDNDTFIIGVGGRFRVRPSVYVVGEIVPRVAGHDPGTHAGSFAIEKRVGGHVFQLNFSNTLGTTMGQLARGGVSSDTWYLGFNITRKFF
ncbi:MAG: hypothetical protein GEU99_19940 [Luteitalea sp.]|nr:hypothetical protein [Luteitalea sp.]